LNESRVPTPMWRRFLSPPGTRIGWWSFGFVASHALVAIVLLVAAIYEAVSVIFIMQDA
jgi:hypothetical protein